MKPSTTSLVLASVAAVHSQDFNSTIVGCVGLDCPPSSADAANDNCTVASDSFTLVGLTRIPTTQEPLKGVSWTNAFKIFDDQNGNRTFQSSFYLGTPPDLKLSSTGACSVFLHGVSTSLSFGGADGKNETAQGPCSDAMGSSCVNALLDRARALFKAQESETDRNDLCALLQDDMDKNMDDACKGITGGSWGKLSSKDLTGGDAPSPIGEKENSTSTCWPVLPKSNSLTHVTDDKVPGTLNIADAQRAQFAITPIITLFYPNGTGSIINDIDASLTCTKVVGPSKASVDTMSDGSQNGDKSSGMSLLPPTMLASLGALSALLFMGV